MEYWFETLYVFFFFKFQHICKNMKCNNSIHICMTQIKYFKILYLMYDLNVECPEETCTENIVRTLCSIDKNNLENFFPFYIQSYYWMIRRMYYMEYSNRKIYNIIQIRFSSKTILNRIKQKFQNKSHF